MSKKIILKIDDAETIVFMKSDKSNQISDPVKI